MNQTKSKAAMRNAQKGGLHQQRRGGKSIKQQVKLVALASHRPRLTGTQLSWLAVGGTVDESGRCQPESEFNRMNDYFGFKRRLSEISCSAEDLDEHPKAKLIYCEPVNNPYTEAGGHGLVLVGSRAGVASSAAPAKPVIQESEAMAEVDAAGHIDSIQSMFD